MVQRIAGVLIGVVLSGTPVWAQSPTSKPAAASDGAATKFVGEWEGAFQTDHGHGGAMSMRITKDSVWKATADVLAGSETIPNTISNVSVDGNTIVWTQELMGMMCKASAVLDGAELKGTTDCGHASMTIALRKK
jgi:hypothetical protein